MDECIEFRSVVLDACVVQSPRCEQAAVRADNLTGGRCINEPLFENGPPLAYYLCHNPRSAHLRSSCDDAGWAATVVGETSSHDGRGRSGSDTAGTPSTAVKGTALASGLALLAGGAAAREGRLGGRLGTELTFAIGSERGKLHRSEAAKQTVFDRLESQADYRWYGAEGRIDRQMFEDLRDRVQIGMDEQLTMGQTIKEFQAISSAVKRAYEPRR